MYNIRDQIDVVDDVVDVDVVAVSNPNGWPCMSSDFYQVAVVEMMVMNDMVMMQRKNNYITSFGQQNIRNQILLLEGGIRRLR